MKSEHLENGMEELLRLSRGLSKKTEDAGRQEARKKRERAEQKQALLGMRGITFSMALEQLKIISAEADVIKKVGSCQAKEGTEDLRKLIVALTGELESRVSKMTRAAPEMSGLERSVKTLSILIDLVFSLD